MPSPWITFGGAALGTVVFLNIVLKPKTFRTVMIGMGIGLTFGGTITYINSLRRHTLTAQYVPIGLTGPQANFSLIQPKIYEHLSQEYEERGELELGEEHITVKPNVFAQIGVLDIGGVRTMWTKEVLPYMKECIQKKLFTASNSSDTNVENEIVFCDIGSGVGNICLQILAETNCKKTVGIEVIPSRHTAAETAFRNAQTLYPDIYKDKNALWVEEDLVHCATTLKKEGVNVVFTHSWMFDDDLMQQFTKVITEVPSIACVITSRKLDEGLLKATPLKLHSLSHFSADWNDRAPFYVYTRSGN